MSFQCTFCQGRVFKSRYAYESHLLGKSVHKPFKCPVRGCPKGYNAMDTLVAHYAKLHLGLASGSVPCPRCPEVFSSVPDLIAHRSSAHPLVWCDPCVQFVHQEDIPTHLLTSPCHPICTQCGVGFQDSVAFTEHQHSLPARHGADMRSIISEESLTTQSPASLTGRYEDLVTCTPCGLQFRSAHLLENHYRSSHPACGLCDTGFVDEKAYAEHVEACHQPFTSKISISILRSPSICTSPKHLGSLSIEPTSEGGANPSKPHEHALGEISTLKGETPTEGLCFSPAIASSPITEAPASCPIESSQCELRSQQTSQRDPQPSASSRSLCPQNSEGKSQTVACDFCSKQDTPASSPARAEVIGLWKCRICHNEPNQPTVTMCGHLFCENCIIQEISSTLQCPVCETPVLIKLDV